MKQVIDNLVKHEDEDTCLDNPSRSLQSVQWSHLGIFLQCCCYQCFCWLSYKILHCHIEYTFIDYSIVLQRNILSYTAIYCLIFYYFVIEFKRNISRPIEYHIVQKSILSGIVYIVLWRNILSYRVSIILSYSLLYHELSKLSY